MKQKKLLMQLLVGCAAIALAVAFMPGCEKNSDTTIPEITTNTATIITTDPPTVVGDFAVTPASAGVQSGHYETEKVGVPDIVGQTVTFAASGGADPYSNWSVVGSGVGTISQSGVFTFSGAIGTNQISVNDSQGRIGYASVYAIYRPAPSPSLTITPASVTLTSSSSNSTASLSGKIVNFEASGGVTPYTWYLDQPAFGSITPRTGSATAITLVSGSPPIGTCNITVYDSAGGEVTATVTTQFAPP